jgi:hypothetical protein
MRSLMDDAVDALKAGNTDDYLGQAENAADHDAAAQHERGEHALSNV